MSKTRLIAVAAALVAVFMWARSSGDGAPVSDGAYLDYEQAGSRTRLSFHRLDDDRYLATLELLGEGGTSQGASRVDTVDLRMRTPRGGIFEVGSLGPLWVPARDVREGGSAHGTRIDEVRMWEGREVGVVSASLGMGAALRGEWYYDTVTGFLVGGTKTTALSEPGPGQVFRVVNSNIPGLDGG